MISIKSFRIGIIILFVTAFYSLSFPQQMDTDSVGGPDNFGHRWITSRAPGYTVDFDWEDALAGSVVQINDDDSTGTPLNIGFTFNFYGIDYTQFYVSSEGFISFTALASHYEAENDSGVPNTSLPNNIVKLSILNELKAGENNLKNLPESINKMKSLKKLYLNGNKFEVFPENILELNNLIDLGLGANNLKFLPENINKLKNLQRLDLALNQLTRLPDSICNLKNLTTLFIMGNPLTGLPENIINVSVGKPSILFDYLKEKFNEN